MFGQGEMVLIRDKSSAISALTIINGISVFVSLWLFSGSILFVSDSAEISPDFVTGFHPSTSNVTFFKSYGKSANGAPRLLVHLCRVVGR